MNLLITGAAGNLGSHLARHLIAANSNDQPDNQPSIAANRSTYHLNLLIHRHEPPQDIAQAPSVTIYKADLAKPETLTEPCQNTDCVIHFAGVLFAARPEKFLPETNTLYARNVIDAALQAGVKKFILVSFPHVEGKSTPEHPARGILPAGNPDSAHARTRLAAERYLFEASANTQMTPIVLRPGMIFSRGILMIDAARWLSRRRLLAVWKEPTWIHLLSLPDFLAATQAAIESATARGIYNLGDDQPLTLQEFLDRAAKVWGITPGIGRHPPRWILQRFRRGESLEENRKESLEERRRESLEENCKGSQEESPPWWEGRPPWRAPRWSFYAAAALTEAFATIVRTRAPLTRDFIRIGMASYTMDTSRMKRELLPELKYPTLHEGIVLLQG